MLCGPLGRNASGSAFSRSRRANGMPSVSWRHTEPPDDGAAPGQCPLLSAVVRAGYSTGRTCDAEFRHGFGFAFAAHIPDSPALAEFNFSIMAFSFAAKLRP
jgi:hypothetical protein